MNHESNSCSAVGTQSLANQNSIIYFIGCDMGGWHTNKNTGGDALAVCKWDGTDFSRVGEQRGRLFYPVESSATTPAGQTGQNVANFTKRVNSKRVPSVRKDKILDGLVSAMVHEEARVIIAIDAALAWPTGFANLVADVPSARHRPKFDPNDGAINNPYLYRETERFIKAAVLTKENERPLTAPGDPRNGFIYSTPPLFPDEGWIFCPK